MKKIQKDELYRNLGEFLKNKGIELKEGSYATTIQKSCGLLADVINLSQQSMERAKTGVDQKLDRLRQAIHEKTAPKPPPPAPPTTATVSPLVPPVQTASPGASPKKPVRKKAAGKPAPPKKAKSRKNVL